MKHLIITGHSKISEGISAAIKFVLGIEVPYFNAYVENEESFKDRIIKEIEKYPNEDDIIIATDIFGGSVNNEMMQLLNRPNIYLVSGMNMALVAALAMAGDTEDTEHLIRSCIEQAKEGIVFCNEALLSEADDLDEF